MKKILILLVFLMVLLAVPFSLPAYDASPSYWKVVPECIWASASGGGTWKTEIQVTNMTSNPAAISVTFFYGGGLIRGPFVLTTGLSVYRSLKYSNILETIDDLDADPFTYYGRVGALVFFTGNAAYKILVTAKTVNGNYGKTFPGLNVVEANTAAYLREMVIHSLVNNATYRTFTGFFNTSVTATYSVTFTIINSENVLVGTQFTKSFLPSEYMAFNPFVEAGVGSGIFDNCWLWITPMSGGSDFRGIMGFGAIANNTSNDPSALIAYPFD